MKVLAIETATGTAGAAVIVGGEVQAEETRTARDHAELLSSLVETALARAGVRVRDVDAVAVSCGPGSFTGLRIGLSFAKGLALATGAALIGVPTLEALAASSGIDSGWVVPILDARRGEVYSAKFVARGPGRLEAVSAPEVVPIATFLGRLERPAAFVGEGVQVYGRQIEAHMSPGSTLHPQVAPRASVVARIGLRLLECGEAARPAMLEPAYVGLPTIRVPADRSGAPQIS